MEISTIGPLRILSYPAPHCGKKGQRGGSAPRSECASGREETTGREATIAEPAADYQTNEIPPEAIAAGEKLIARTKEYEPEVTSMLEEIATQTRGEFAGLEHRLKKMERLAEKICDDMIEKDLTADEAAAQVNDALRFTLLYDADEFVEKVKETQRLLAERGFVQYDHKWKNFFKPGDDYDGYNTVVHNPETGEKFELQFHTHETIVIKEDCHKMYKIWRTLPEGSPKRLSLWEKMGGLWNNYPRPANWQSLPGEIK